MKISPLAGIILSSLRREDRYRQEVAQWLADSTDDTAGPMPPRAQFWGRRIKPWRR